MTYEMTEQDKRDLDEAMRILEEQTLRQCARDKRILNAIRKINGDSFHDELKDIIIDLDQCGGFSIVDEPKGSYQTEDWGIIIPGVWVDQWRNGGYTGDDFAGDVYVKITRPNKTDKYLKLPYQM